MTRCACLAQGLISTYSVASLEQGTQHMHRQQRATSAHHLGAAGCEDEGDVPGLHEGLADQQRGLLDPGDDVWGRWGGWERRALARDDQLPKPGTHCSESCGWTRHSASLLAGRHAPCSGACQRSAHPPGRRPPLRRRARCGPPRWCTSWHAGAGTAPVEGVVEIQKGFCQPATSSMHGACLEPTAAAPCQTAQRFNGTTLRTSALRVLSVSSDLKMAVEVGFCRGQMDGEAARVGIHARLPQSMVARKSPCIPPQHCGPCSQCCCPPLHPQP